MTGILHLSGITVRVAAILFVLGSCVGAQAPEAGAAAVNIPPPPAPVINPSPEPQLGGLDGVAPVGLSVADLAQPDLSLVDTDGATLRAEHAEIVRAVHRALAAGDLTALGGLYAGDDWAGQAELLANEQVRRSVLDALRAQPANLGEGYVYPGFAADPAVPYSGYLTGFFLDYDPPQTAAGPLRWRGIMPRSEA